MSKCEICGGSGYHKLSCGNNTARVAIPMSCIRDQIEKLTPSDYEVMQETVCALNAYQHLREMKQKSSSARQMRTSG
jgi:hypothetical protein